MASIKGNVINVKGKKVPSRSITLTGDLLAFELGGNTNVVNAKTEANYVFSGGLASQTFSGVFDASVIEFSSSAGGKNEFGEAKAAKIGGDDITIYDGSEYRVIEYTDTFSVKATEAYSILDAAITSEVSTQSFSVPSPNPSSVSSSISFFDDFTNFVEINDLVLSDENWRQSGVSVLYNEDAVIEGGGDICSVIVLRNAVAGVRGIFFGSAVSSAPTGGVKLKDIEEVSFRLAFDGTDFANQTIRFGVTNIVDLETQSNVEGVFFKKEIGETQFYGQGNSSGFASSSVGPLAVTALKYTTFRIVPTSSGADFYVDGVLVASGAGGDFTDDQKPVTPFLSVSHNTDNTSVRVFLDYVSVKYKSTPLSR